MKIKTITTLLIVLFCSCNLAAASGEGGVYVGNGGSGVLCKNELPPPLGGDDVTMMEYMLAGFAVMPFGNKEFNRFNSLTTYEEALSFFMAKLNRSPEFMLELKSISPLIKMDFSSFVDGPLVRVDEPLLFPLPDKCERVQVAVRRADRIYIDKGLYNLMSAEQKVLLYLHEYIYAMGVLKYGHTSSGRTQELLSFLMREDPKAEDLEVYLDKFFYLKN